MISERLSFLDDDINKLSVSFEKRVKKGRLEERERERETERERERERETDREREREREMVTLAICSMDWVVLCSELVGQISI